MYSENEIINSIYDMGNKKDWHGLMRVLWFEHVRDGKIIYREEDILNVLHTQGSAFVLKAMFMGGNSPNAFIPSNYYLGLDSRATIAVSDTMENVQAEPFVNGYIRQPVSSLTGFSLSVVGGIYQAASQIVTFSATGGSWGPVVNIFLSDKLNTAGTLISSAKLTNPVTVQSGDSVNMRMAMSLQYCPS